VAALRETASRLGRDAPGGVLDVHSCPAAAFLGEAAIRGQVWDLAFVDPPFDGGLWDATLAALVPCLAARAHVYVEAAVGASVRVPSGWSTHRELVTREARATLYRVGTG
jgi:16S rRNA (guanine966-N2)-methyltransferase